MQQTIDQITDYLAGLVTTNKAAYSPKDLLKANIPAFVVERIRLTMEDKVREELNEANFTWFALENRFVQETWNDFLNSAIGASHLPKEHLYNVLHAVVTEVIYVFIEPRKHFAEYVFREDEELTFEEIEARCARVTVYKHFATAIPLYMKKRELDSLTKERCSLLIHKLDAKLVAAYSPDDWAQKLDQLFVLFGGKVDPMLLTTFFEDKGLSAMAEKFRKRKKKISRADFIDVITGKADEEHSPEPKVDSLGSEENRSLMDSFFVDHADDPASSRLYDDSLANQFLEGNLSEDEMKELLEDIASDGVVEVDDHDQVASLNELFLNEDMEDEISETAEEIAANIKKAAKNDQEDVKEFRVNLISILDQAKDSFEHIVHPEEDDATLEITQKPILEDSLIDENTIFEEPDLTGEHKVENDEEQPMWAKFLNADQMDVIMGSKRSEEREEQVEDHSLTFTDSDTDDDVFDLTNGVDDTNEVFDNIDVPNSENLRKLLNDRSLEFIDVIFKGSEEDFDQALQTMSGFESWKETSAFIKDEIFKKNDVDLFSGATVDFTDRMHRHFNERTNK